MSLPSPRRRQLVAVLAGIAALFVIISLPDLAPPPSGGEPIEVVRARIVEFLPPQQPVDPSAPELGIQPDVLVEVLDGPRSGQRTGAYLQGPSGELDLPRYALGEEVVVTFTQQPEGGDFVAVSDRWRLPTLAFLTVAFGAAVALVAGGRGLRALLALALTVAIVLKIVVPLLLQGVEPIPLAVIVASFVTVLTIGLTEGITRPAVAAILGTFAALALTAVLSAVSTTLAGFTNAAGTDLVYLQGTTAGTPLDLRGMLLAAFIFGALGVLDDVTVTQAATVEELATRGGLRGGELLRSALNVGRSHIAATINTLFLAYVGASLPLLVLFGVVQQPAFVIANDEIVAVEIVRTLVGSLGIVAAVPLTTLIATWLVVPGEVPDPRAGGIGA